MRGAAGFFTALGLAAVLVGCGPAAASNPGAAHLGARTKTAGCAYASGGKLPDPACTPGAIIATATKAQVCQAGYAKNVRDVPTSEKDAVYREYAVRSHRAGQYEVDHLVSLELGGSNDVANLWPQPAEPRPGFHEKDQVEDYLHRQVCSGAVTLPQAQEQIATDWMSVYRRLPKK